MGKNTIEAEEQKYVALRNAIKEGIDSGVAINFDPKQHLEFLKKKIGREMSKFQFSVSG